MATESLPTIKRKQYPTRELAERDARYLDQFGGRASRYSWSVAPHPDGGYELRKTPQESEPDD